MQMFSDYGLDVLASDWKGVFAPAELKRDEFQTLSDIFYKMSQSETWEKELFEHNWQNFYLAGADFDRFVQQEFEVIKELRLNYSVSRVPGDRIAKIVGRQYRWAIIVGFGFLILLIAQRLYSRSRHERLRVSLTQAQEELRAKLGGASEHIDSEFKKWSLTTSETEIGWLLLKGLSFKEIAKARGTSERTVRHQAQSVYSKSGLNSRSDLAAYFFEDFVFGTANTLESTF